MSKHKLDQKRLESLRRQLYGLERPVKKTTKKETPTVDSTVTDPESVPQSNFLNRFSLNPTITAKKDTDSSSQTVYLKRDLFKILTLSSLALTIQVLLYFGLRNNLLNLSFTK